VTPELIRMELHNQMRETDAAQSTFRAQVTLIPPMRADTDPHGSQPVNISYNVFAGVNDVVEGIEFGGLANVTKDRMKGIQMAGLVNVVDQDFEGIQAAGLINAVGSTAHGVQMAGLANVAGSGTLVQTAGLVNYARGDVHSQIAGLVNVAGNVKGVQIGLLNIAGSSEGVPVGLMSIVRRRGYHSLEVAVEDAIDYNINLRLGVRAFYNILHVGLDNKGENWTLGYGIGTSIWLERRNFLQFELMARQINEGDPWTRELNLLSQLKMNYDFAVGKNLRIALGPTLNVATSRRYDPESGTYGTQVPRYVMFEHTYDDNYHLPLNVKYWVGFHAGIRFGSADTFRERGNRFIE
jgi:hypothetical protein